MADFPLEKILSISAIDYLTMKAHTGSIHEIYKMHGINLNILNPDSRALEDQNYIAKIFAKAVPSEAEVVVNYSARFADVSASVSGVALIAKK